MIVSKTLIILSLLLINNKVKTKTNSLTFIIKLNFNDRFTKRCLCFFVEFSHIVFVS